MKRKTREFNKKLKKSYFKGRLEGGQHYRHQMEIREIRLKNLLLKNVSEQVMNYINSGMDVNIKFDISAKELLEILNFNIMDRPDDIIKNVVVHNYEESGVKRQRFSFSFYSHKIEGMNKKQVIEYIQSRIIEILNEEGKIVYNIDMSSLEFMDINNNIYPHYIYSKGYSVIVYYKDINNKKEVNKNDILSI